jgi:secreted PhoX family phosphatase
MVDMTVKPPMQPATGGVNQLYRWRHGSGDPQLFGVVPGGGEPTGPWFHPNGRIMYLSIQADPGRILAIRGPWAKGS